MEWIEKPMVRDESQQKSILESGSANGIHIRTWLFGVLTVDFFWKSRSANNAQTLCKYHSYSYSGKS